MKKKLFILIIISLGLISCNEVKDQSKNIDFDKIWFSEKMIDTPAQLPEGVSDRLFDTIAYYMEREKISQLRVEYNLLVNKNGMVEQITIEESDNSMMDSIIIASLKDWKFNAGMRSGINVNTIFPLKLHLKVGESSINEKDYFIAVEQMPEPIGGIQAIQSKILYPEIAKRAGIEGRVFILAFIDENGDVANAKVIKGIGAGCDESALDAVKQTKFTPGKQKGKPVKVQVTIPIQFKLQ